MLLYSWHGYPILGLLKCFAVRHQRFKNFINSHHTHLCIFSVSQPPDKILREASHEADFDVPASNMDALYLQDAVT